LREKHAVLRDVYHSRLNLGINQYTQPQFRRDNTALKKAINGKKPNQQPPSPIPCVGVTLTPKYLWDSIITRHSLKEKNQTVFARAPKQGELKGT
jgi:hypothetical protein